MAQASGATWTVTSQREDFQVGPNGQLAQGVVVTFTTGSGHTGSVFIPNVDYTVEKVRAMVAQRAAMMEAVGQLSEG